MKRCGKHTWREIGAQVGVNKTTARARYLHRPSGLTTEYCPICADDPTEPHGTSFEESGNHAEAKATSDRIQTLDQLLEAAEVDLETWRVVDWGVKKWEVGAKIKTGHLEWEAGKIDGYIDYKGLGVEPLWSVWAKFIRIQPVALNPSLQPVQVQVTRRPARLPEGQGVVRALFGGDPQFGFRRHRRTGRLDPFHDRRALDLFLQVAEAEQPETIGWGGDIQDFCNLSDKFLRDADFLLSAQPAICEAHWWLCQLREACPDADIVLLEGNHDARLRKAILTHLRAIYDLRAADEIELPPPLSPERLMGLAALGIRWIGDYPNEEYWLHSRLRVVHGNTARSAPGATARAIAEGSDSSTLFFHAHRRGLVMVSRTIYERGRSRTITAFSPGCLCRTDGAVPGTKARQNWQQGMVMVDLAENRQTPSIIEIQDGEAIWDRRMFTARDRVSDLRRDIPDFQW